MPTQPKDTLREEFEEESPRFYGGRKGDKITQVTLTETGIKMSKENILSFIQEKITEAREEERRKLKECADNYFKDLSNF
jgi:hypothetical protein